MATLTGFLARAWVLRRRALKARLLNILLYAFLGCPRAAAVRLLPRAYHHEIVWLLSIAAGGAGLPRGTAGPLALIFNGFGVGFLRSPAHLPTLVFDVRVLYEWSTRGRGERQYDGMSAFWSAGDDAVSRRPTQAKNSASGAFL